MSSIRMFARRLLLLPLIFRFKRRRESMDDSTVTGREYTLLRKFLVEELAGSVLYRLETTGLCKNECTRMRPTLLLALGAWWDGWMNAQGWTRRSE
jgi:hypothetical protein